MDNYSYIRYETWPATYPFFGLPCPVEAKIEPFQFSMQPLQQFYYFETVTL